MVLVDSQIRETIFDPCVSLDTSPRLWCGAALGRWKRNLGSQKDLKPRSQKTFLFSSQRKRPFRFRKRSILQKKQGRGRLPEEGELKRVKTQSTWAGPMVPATNNEVDVTGRCWKCEFFINRQLPQIST